MRLSKNRDQTWFAASLGTNGLVILKKVQNPLGSDFMNEDGKFSDVLQEAKQKIKWMMDHPDDFQYTK